MPLDLVIPIPSVSAYALTSSRRNQQIEKLPAGRGYDSHTGWRDLEPYNRRVLERRRPEAAAACSTSGEHLTGSAKEVLAHTHLPSKYRICSTHFSSPPRELLVTGELFISLLSIHLSFPPCFHPSLLRRPQTQSCACSQS